MHPMSCIRDAVLDHIEGTTFESLSGDVVQATNVMIADTLACALIGSSDQKAEAVRDVQLDHFGFGGVPVWGTNKLMSPIGAGMANGYQIHCLDYDCCHEAANVHAMSVIFPAVMAYADRYGRVPGKDLITAINVGTDIAVLLGLEAQRRVTAFSPEVCCALGTGAAIAKLSGLHRASITDLFDLIYSQSPGTTEADGSNDGALSSMQIAFGVRNVLTAYDLVHRAFTVPDDTRDGTFGYLNLFETDGGSAPDLDTFKRVRRTAEISFMPFPASRASHAAIDVLLRLKVEHGFSAEDVSSVTVSVPSHAHRIAGRPVMDRMSGPYARHCLPYLLATALIDGTLDATAYASEALRESARLTLAQRVSVEVNGVTDAGTLSPQAMTTTLTDGRTVSATAAKCPGHPESPLPADQLREKFLSSAESAVKPLSREAANIVYDRLLALENEADVSMVSHLACGRDVERDVV